MSAPREITEPMVEAAAQRMVALVMGGLIERPQIVQWQQWAGSARAILEAAFEAGFAPSAEQRSAADIERDIIRYGFFRQTKRMEEAEELFRKLQGALRCMPSHVGASGGDPAEPKSDHDRIAAICELDGCQAFRSAIAATELNRWNLVRRWLTQHEPLYIPGIHQARTDEAVNEAVDRAIERLRATDRGL